MRERGGREKGREEKKDGRGTFVAVGGGWSGMGLGIEVWDVLYLWLKSPQPHLCPNQNQMVFYLYFLVGDAFVSRN